MLKKSDTCDSDQLERPRLGASHLWTQPGAQTQGGLVHSVSTAVEPRFLSDIAEAVQRCLLQSCSNIQLDNRCSWMSLQRSMFQHHTPEAIPPQFRKNVQQGKFDIQTGLQLSTSLLGMASSQQVWYQCNRILPDIVCKSIGRRRKRNLHHKKS